MTPQPAPVPRMSETNNCGHPPYTVTVTDESGAVIFIGRPSQQQDTFAIVQKAGQPSRLLCSVTDVIAEVPNER